MKQNILSLNMHVIQYLDLQIFFCLYFIIVCVLKFTQLPHLPDETFLVCHFFLLFSGSPVLVTVQDLSLPRCFSFCFPDHR